MGSLSSPFMSMAVDSFMAISVKDSGLLSENIKLFSRIIVNDGNSRYLHSVILCGFMWSYGTLQVIEKDAYDRKRY